VFIEVLTIPFHYGFGIGGAISNLAKQRRGVNSIFPLNLYIIFVFSLLMNLFYWGECQHVGIINFFLFGKTIDHSFWPYRFVEVVRTFGGGCGA
jgi:hypothetical protein